MKKIISGLLGMVIGAVVSGTVIEKRSKEENKKIKNMSDKHLALFLMMNQWVRVKQEGKILASYFEEHGYKNVAIYGMSYAGETLMEELRDTEIKVLYGIDKKADAICTDVDIYTPDDELPDTDVIVVTAIVFYEEIKEQLEKAVKCPIVSLEDVLYEM